MAGRRGFRAYPRHLAKTKGKGYYQSEASGFLRPVSDRVEDVRQGQVPHEEADITPGFGTRHPQDVVQLGNLSDPSPVANAIPEQPILSKSDLLISDQEVEASIKEGRPPRSGF